MNRAYVTTSAGKLEYSTTADVSEASRTLVLLHHGLGSIEQWGTFPEIVSERLGYPAVCYTRPGYGRSDPRDKPPDADVFHREADLLAELIDRLSIGPHLIVGHSDGASIAIVYASRRPDGLLASFLVAPHIFLEEKNRLAIAALDKNFGDGRLLKGLAKYHDDADTMFKSWSGAWLSPPFRDMDLSEELAAISTPTLVLQGTQDEFATGFHLEEIGRRSSELVEARVVAGWDHEPQRHNPVALAEMAEDFFASVTA